MPVPASKLPVYRWALSSLVSGHGLLVVVIAGQSLRSSPTVRWCDDNDKKVLHLYHVFTAVVSGAIPPTVRPSVKLVNCDKTKQTSVHIVTLYERSMNLFFNTKNVDGGRPLLPEILGQIHNKYFLWNVYLPDVVAFHTRLSKYLTVIVMTLN